MIDHTWRNDNLPEAENILLKKFSVAGGFEKSLQS